MKQSRGDNVLVLCTATGTIGRLLRRPDKSGLLTIRDGAGGGVVVHSP